MSQSDNEFLDETALLEESDNVEAEGDLSYENGEDANDPVRYSIFIKIIRKGYKRAIIPW